MFAFVHLYTYAFNTIEVNLSRGGLARSFCQWVPRPNHSFCGCDFIIRLVCICGCSFIHTFQNVYCIYAVYEVNEVTFYVCLLQICIMKVMANGMDCLALFHRCRLLSCLQVVGGAVSGSQKKKKICSRLHSSYKYCAVHMTGQEQKANKLQHLKWKSNNWS